MIADVYGFMHPTLRTVAWTSTLSLLCFLLNNIIPFTIAVSMGRTLGLPRILAGFMGMALVFVFQLGFWFIGETLLSDKSETWKDHNNVFIVIFLYQQLLLKDLEHSVAIVAMMGTFASAIVAGFATISFPMDQVGMVCPVTLCAFLHLHARPDPYTPLPSPADDLSRRQREAAPSQGACAYRGVGHVGGA
jgi:hypothetical protein